MLQGDLDTMPLAEVLQWIDFSGRGGLLTLTQEGYVSWMVLEKRELRAACPPPQEAALIASLRPEAADEPWLRLPPAVEAEERLLDLFLLDGGSFSFDAKGEAEGGPSLELPIRKLVHEGMRHRDEWPALDARYPDEGAALKVGAKAEPAGLGPLGRVLLRCASRGLSLGDVRVSFGLSRPAVLRRVHELVRLEILGVAGSNAGHDPVGELTQKALQLAAAGQFDEARHVLETVLSTDPNDAHLRGLLEEVASHQLKELHTLLSEESRLLHRTQQGSLGEPAGLSATERELYEQIEDGMQVGHLVLCSKLRELETLRTVEKMLHLSLISVEPAAPNAAEQESPEAPR